MKPFYVHIFAVATVFVTPIFADVLPEDRFSQLFRAKASLNEIMSEIMSIDPITNYGHYQTVLEHIKKKDEYATYAKTLVTATQKVLDHILSEIGYNEAVNVSKFIDIAYGMATGKSIPDAKMMNLLMRVNIYVNQVYQEAVQQVKKNVMEKLMKVVEGGQSKGNNVNKEKSKGKSAARKVRRSRTRPTSEEN